MGHFFRFSVLLQIMSIRWIMMSVEGSSNRSRPVGRVVYASDLQINVIRSWSPGIQNNEELNLLGSQRSSTLDQDSSLVCSGDALIVQFSIPPNYSENSKFEQQEAGKEDLNHRFTLYLQPSSTQFLHPNAMITYQLSNGTSTHSSQNFMTTKPIITDEVLAYSGTAIAEDDMVSLNGSHIGLDNWANILIHHPYGEKCVKNSNNLILEGAFQVNGRLWHIKSLDSYHKIRSPHDSEPKKMGSDFKLQSRLVVWTDSDEWAMNGATSKEDKFQQQHLQNKTSNREITEAASSLQMTYTESSTQHFLQKRQTMISDMAGLTGEKVDYARTIGSTNGCPTSPKMVYIGIAVDCTYLRKHGSTDAVRLAVLNNMHLVSSVYQRTFNISLGIVEINMPAESTCPSQPSSDRPWNIDCPDASSQGLDINERLNQFSKWRSDKGGSDGAGLWHLLTDCPNGSQVGVSWLGSLCKVNAEQGANGGTTSGTGVTASTPNEWETMAHEIGHNFGAVHDCTSGCSMEDSCCPASTSSCNNNDQNIMAPSSSSGSTLSFSACSIGNICGSLKPGNSQRMDSSCVTELGQHYTMSLNQCGNGILEPGEDCDSGQIFSPCCQWGVCKFSPGSVCMPSANSPCCSANCQFTPASTPCNSSGSPSAMCSGSSSNCPSSPAIESSDFSSSF